MILKIRHAKAGENGILGMVQIQVTDFDSDETDFIVLTQYGLIGCMDSFHGLLAHTLLPKNWWDEPCRILEFNSP